MAEQKKAIEKRGVKNALITKEDVTAAKYKQQVRSIERQGNIAALNDYVGFAVSKVGGIGATVIGGLELLDPSILPINLTMPVAAQLVGLGLALVAGKSILKIIGKLEEALGGKDE